MLGRVVDHGPGLGYYHLDLTECAMALLAGLDPEMEGGRCVGEHFPTVDYLEVWVQEVP